MKQTRKYPAVASEPGIQNQSKAPVSITRIKPKKPSLRRAINAKCKDCVYDRTNCGTWRQQVELCTCSDCPLYPVRPKSSAQGNGRIAAKNATSADVSRQVSE